MAKKAKEVKVKVEKEKVKEKPQAIVYHDGTDKYPSVVGVTGTFPSKLDAEKHLFNKGWRGGTDGKSWQNHNRSTVIPAPHQKIPASARGLFLFIS